MRPQRDASCGRRRSSRSAPRGRGASPERASARRARRCARWRFDDAARSLPRHPQAVRKIGGPSICGLQLQLRRTTSPTRRSTAGSSMTKALGAEVHHLVHDADGGEARRAVRREAQDGRGGAQPLEHRATPTSSPRRRALPRRWRCRRTSRSISTSATSPPPTTTPVAFLREHHADITNLHLKDRKKNQGDNVPWGQGDTPITRGAAAAQEGEVADARLRRVRVPRRRPGAVDEVKTCFDYAKRALA